MNLTVTNSRSSNNKCIKNRVIESERERKNIKKFKENDYYVTIFFHASIMSKHKKTSFPSANMHQRFTFSHVHSSLSLRNRCYCSATMTDLIFLLLSFSLAFSNTHKQKLNFFSVSRLFGIALFLHFHFYAGIMRAKSYIFVFFERRWLIQSFSEAHEYL